MSDIDSLRRTKLKVSVNNVDITEDVNKHLVSATFTDVEDGEPDDLELVLEDRDNEIVGKWLNTEIAKRGQSKNKGKCPHKEPSKTLKRGSKGSGVKWVQWYVNRAEGTSIKVNGVYGTSTVNAVKKFQKKAKLKQSGICDSGTRSKLKKTVDDKTSSTAKNATISMKITQCNWDSDGKDITLNCGRFELDETSTKGPKQEVTLRGTACAFNSGIRKKKYTKAWKKTTLQKIAESIGRSCGYTVMYLSKKSISFKRKDQRNQTYIVFLQKLCNLSGLSLKVTNGTLVLFDKKDKEAADSKRTIKRGDGSYSTYSFKTALANTSYSCCHVSYTNTKGKKVEYTYTPPGFKKEKDTTLEIKDEKVDTEAEAKRLAIAKLRAANKAEQTASMTMPGDVTLCAGLTVQFQEFGMYDGKYIIEKATHSIKARGGFTTSIDLRKVITGY